MKSNTHSFRIRIVLGCVIFVGCVLLIKLYFVQIVQSASYTERANKQYTQKTAPLFDRGSIFFTTKESIKVSAATIQEGFSLAINPKAMSDIDTAFQALKQFVVLDKNDFYEKVNKKDDPFEELVKRIDEKTGEEISKQKILGVIVYRDAWRTYPAKSLAAHTIGIMGYKGDVYSGRYGLESFYDSTLSKNKNGTIHNFFAEVFSGLKIAIQGNSGDIITTLEPSVQSHAELVLADAKEKWKSDEIGVIVMDPHSGDIVAMAALPSFNPNDTSKEKNPKIFSNPLVESAYEMGSIIKPLTIAAGLDVGAINIETTYNDTGTILIDKKKISNYDGKARGIVPIQQILSQSLNVGIAFVVQKMGNENLTKYFRSLGFGEVTGIDQPNETKGLSANLNSNRDVEHITAGFGQGISMSPISTIRALSVLANDGVLVTPHIATTIEHDSGMIEELKYPQKTQVFKKETTTQVTKMLVEVVDKALRKGEVKMEHYSIAAKTGTAQIADPVNGGYYTDRYLHSFFGYFPAYDPKYIVFLYQVYPKNTQYASETLTNPFIDIVKFLINYYEIPPDR